MPIPFGVGIGDFIAGIGLIIDCYNALQDAGGAAEDFRQHAAWLKSVLSVLQQAYDSGDDRLQQMAEECSTPLKAFSEKANRKYEKRLGKLTSGTSRVISAPRQIQWALSTKKDLVELRADILPQLQILSVHLGLQTRPLMNASLENLTSIETNVSSLSNQILDVKSQLDPLPALLINQRQISDSLEGMNARFESFNISTCTAQLSTTIENTVPNLLENVFRTEVRRMLQDAISEQFEKAENKKRFQAEPLTKQVLDAIDLMTNQLPHGILQPRCESDIQNEKIHPVSSSWSNNDHLAHSSVLPSTGRKSLVLSQRLTRLCSKQWEFRWRIGTVIVRLETHAVPGTNSSTFDLEVQFLPATHSSWVPGVLTKYTNRPIRGFHHLSPMIMVYRIVPYWREDPGGVMNCAFLDDLEALYKLFGEGKARPTDRDPNGDTMLHYALYCQVSIEMIQYLLIQGADVQAQNSHGSTPIDDFNKTILEELSDSHTYLERKHISEYYESVYLLLESVGVDITERFDSDETFEDYPIQNPWAYGIYKDIDVDLSPTYSVDVQTWVSFLRKRGEINLDYLSSEDETLLMWNAEYSEFDSLVNIHNSISCGANVNLANREGMTALHMCLRHTFSRVELHESEVEQIRTQLKVSTERPMVYPLLVGKLILLIRAGADIYAIDNYGRMPAHLAKEEDVYDDWCTALENCGFPPEEVWDKSWDLQAQWRDRKERLYSALRTAVDEEELAIPPNSTLVQRNVNRRFEVED